MRYSPVCMSGLFPRVMSLSELFVVDPFRAMVRVNENNGAIVRALENDRWRVRTVQHRAAYQRIRFEASLHLTGILSMLNL